MKVDYTISSKPTKTGEEKMIMQRKQRGHSGVKATVVALALSIIGVEADGVKDDLAEDHIVSLTGIGASDQDAETFDVNRYQNTIPNRTMLGGKVTKAYKNPAEEVDEPPRVFQADRNEEHRIRPLMKPQHMMLLGNELKAQSPFPVYVVGADDYIAEQDGRGSEAPSDYVEREKLRSGR